MQTAHDIGALAVLSPTLSTRAGVHLFAGELPAAPSLVEEARALSEATHGRFWRTAPWRWRRSVARRARPGD